MWEEPGLIITLNKSIRNQHGRTDNPLLFLGVFMFLMVVINYSHGRPLLVDYDCTTGRVMRPPLARNLPARIAHLLLAYLGSIVLPTRIGMLSACA